MDASESPDCGRAERGKFVTDISKGAWFNMERLSTGRPVSGLNPGRYAGPMINGSGVTLADGDGLTKGVVRVVAIGTIVCIIGAGSSFGEIFGFV